MRKVSNEAWGTVQKTFADTLSYVRIFSSIPVMLKSDKLIAKMGWSGSVGTDAQSAKRVLRQLKIAINFVDEINKADLLIDYCKPYKATEEEILWLHREIQSGEINDIIQWLISTGE